MNGRSSPTRMRACSLFCARITGRERIVTSPEAASARSTTSARTAPSRITRSTTSPAEPPESSPPMVAPVRGSSCSGTRTSTPSPNCRSRRTSAISTSMSTWSGRVSSSLIAPRMVS